MNLRSKLLLLISLVSLSAPAQADWGFLEPANLLQRIRNQIAKAQINGSLDLVAPEMAEGISAAIRYQLGSEPSYVDGFYTRLDRYVLEADVAPGDIIDDASLPIGFNLRKKSEVIFARQFKRQFESVTALPYTFANLPLNSEKALTRLNVGDFVGFEAQMAFVVSMGSSTFNETVSASASGYALIRGEFIVHLFKVSPTKIRVKFIGNQNRSNGVNTSVSLASGLEFFGLSFIQRRIERFLELNPLEMNSNGTKSDIFLIDYIFDLSNPQAAQAYDRMMQQKVQFRDIRFANPSVDKEDIRKTIITDLSAIETVFIEDKNLPPGQRRVDRLFKGTNSSHNTESRFKFGFNLFRFEFGSTFASSRIVSFDRSDITSQYIIDTHAHLDKVRVAFGLFGDEHLNTTNLLFLANEEWVPQKFVALTLSEKTKMRSVSKSDYRKVMKRVQRVIPESEFQRIDWKPFDFSKANPVNGYFQQEIFLLPAAIDNLPILSQPTLIDRFTELARSFGRPPFDPYYPRPYYSDSQPMDWIDLFEDDIKYIALFLSHALNPMNSAGERFGNFTKLRNIPLWREYGHLLLLSLLPKEKVPQLISYEMTFVAKGTPEISYKFGNFSEQNLYNSLIYIQNIITNRSFDLRLWLDSDGNYSAESTEKPLD